MSQSRTNYKVVNQQLFASVSPREKSTQVQSQLRFDTSSLADMIGSGIKSKFGGTSSFKSTLRKKESKLIPNLSIRNQI